ncbi:hypothetical protein [Neisseria chenwenguii]|uniref:hypothetical protein n=1 Tax=Neisseria chenwenguii TaxID=1853278 RepID=UPI0012FD5D44|nr:hypothetical protein [Neisseria chenwenguii]
MGIIWEGEMGLDDWIRLTALSIGILSQLMGIAIAVFRYSMKIDLKMILVAMTNLMIIWIISEVNIWLLMDLGWCKGCISWFE